MENFPHWLVKKRLQRWAESGTTWPSSCFAVARSGSSCMRRSRSSSRSWAKGTSTTKRGWRTSTCSNWRSRGSSARRASWIKVRPTQRTSGNAHEKNIYITPDQSPVLVGACKFAQPVHMCLVDLEKAFMDRTSRRSPRFSDLRIGSLLFADDVLLLAPSVRYLQLSLARRPSSRFAGRSLFLPSPVVTSSDRKNEIACTSGWIKLPLQGGWALLETGWEAPSSWRSSE